MKSLHIGKTGQAVIATAVIVAGGIFLTSRISSKRVVPSHIRCAIELKEMEDTAGGLLTGYNYYLLERFAAEHENATLEINISHQGANYMDSLKSGKIDLFVVPMATDRLDDSLEVSIPVDSISLWILPHGSKKMVKCINRWIDSFQKAPDFKSTRHLFLHTFEPFSTAKANIHYPHLSPYDTIIRRYADTLGWDWKLLAAVVYQESHFKIDARSHKGAIGLMQMMPYTAGRWADGDIVNPTTNIEAGVRYLNFLQKRYVRIAGSLKEKQKYTLAAYNAGEGRIKDVINYSRLRDVDLQYWDNVAAIIPEMRDEELMASTDTVKLGSFLGTETINYVNRVFDLYWAFSKIFDEEHECE